jgi:hypothetical protein
MCHERKGATSTLSMRQLFLAVFICGLSSTAEIRRVPRRLKPPSLTCSIVVVIKLLTSTP